jgi:oligopeptidase A
MNVNALLDFTGLPRFDAITSADVQPAISELLAQAHAVVEQLTNEHVAATWKIGRAHV